MIWFVRYHPKQEAAVKQWASTTAQMVPGASAEAALFSHFYEVLNNPTSDLRHWVGLGRLLILLIPHHSLDARVVELQDRLGVAVCIFTFDS